MADPRSGMLTVSSIIGLLAAAFLAMVGGHTWVLPVPIAALSVMLLFNRAGGPLRTVLAILQAIVLGLVTLPLMLNGSGVITLIGCIAAVAAIFHRDPVPGSPMPAWLEQRRVHGRRRRASPPQAGDPAPGAADGAPTEGEDAAGPLAGTRAADLGTP